MTPLSMRSRRICPPPSSIPPSPDSSITSLRHPLLPFSPSPHRPTPPSPPSPPPDDDEKPKVSTRAYDPYSARHSSIPIAAAPTLIQPSQSTCHCDMLLSACCCLQLAVRMRTRYSLYEYTRCCLGALTSPLLDPPVRTVWAPRASWADSQDLFDTPAVIAARFERDWRVVLQIGAASAIGKYSGAAVGGGGADDDGDDGGGGGGGVTIASSSEIESREVAEVLLQSHSTWHQVFAPYFAPHFTLMSRRPRSLTPWHAAVLSCLSIPLLPYLKSTPSPLTHCAVPHHTHSSHSLPPSPRTVLYYE